MADGRVNRAALAVGLTGIVVILVLKRLWRAIPAVAVAVVVGIAAVAAFDLDQEGLKVIGVLPEGLPGFAFPAVDLADLGALFSGAVGIALVAVADTTVLSQSLAARRGDSVDPNQELRALGAANLAAGFFQGFAISSSASRTPVAVSAGAPQPAHAAGRCRRDRPAAGLRPRPAARPARGAASGGHHPGLRRAQGPGQGPPAPLRPVRRRRRRPLFPTVGTAVDGYIGATGTTWVDWEERLPR